MTSVFHSCTCLVAVTQNVCYLQTAKLNNTGFTLDIKTKARRAHTDSIGASIIIVIILIIIMAVILLLLLIIVIINIIAFAFF